MAVFTLSKRSIAPLISRMQGIVPVSAVPYSVEPQVPVGKSSYDKVTSLHVSYLPKSLHQNSRFSTLRTEVTGKRFEYSLESPSTMVRENVQLTELEERIFDVLAEVLKKFGLKTQLRVAGGWVRDKLLGKDSTDIDIAIDDMLGREFCEKINEYYKSLGEETRSVGIILSNPDQSKHLETANMRVLGMSIDFVNLRAETYAEHSRIPQMEFGTPEQDAYRRDLTINSLFYNINKREVEDFTRKGIGDLKAGIIRTPLPAEATFLDDPLRVCRSIRFGARFQFHLDEELKKAAASQAVRNALSNKVSKERIGHEVELMLMGNKPEHALQHIDDFHLFPTIFRIDPNAKPEPRVPDNYGRLCVDSLRAAAAVMAKYESFNLVSKVQKQVCMLGALFLPLRSCTCLDKKRQIPASTHIILKSLMLKNKDASGVETIFNSVKEFKLMSENLLQIGTKSIKECKETVQREDPEIAALYRYRVELGLLLRKTKDLWRCTLLLSSILDLPSVTSQSGAAMLTMSVDNEMWILEKARVCNLVENAVRKLDLETVWEEKPVLNGNELKAALNLDPGKQVQEWKDKVLLWQLAHPRGTADQCLQWVHEENVKRLRV